MDKTLDGQELKAMQQAPSGGEHEAEVLQPTRGVLSGETWEATPDGLQATTTVRLLEGVASFRGGSTWVQRLLLPKCEIDRRLYT